MNDTPVFSQWLKITDNLTDCFGRMKPSALLYAIQEVSGAHSNELGTDVNTLSRRDLFWAVLRTRVEITRLPRLGEKIHLTTWPMPTSRVAYPRAVAAFDEDGRELFRSISLWVLMEGKSRSMILPGKSGVEIMGSLRGLELPVPQGLPARIMPRSRSRAVSGDLPSVLFSPFFGLFSGRAGRSESNRHRGRRSRSSQPPLSA